MKSSSKCALENRGSFMKGDDLLKTEIYSGSPLTTLFQERTVPEELSLFYKSGKSAQQRIIQELGIHLFERPIKNFAKEFIKDLKNTDYYIEFYAGRIPNKTRKAYLALLDEMIFFGINGSRAHYLGYWFNPSSQKDFTALITLSHEDGKLESSSVKLSSYLLSIALTERFGEVRRELTSLGFQNLPNSQDEIDLEVSQLPNPMDQLERYEISLPTRNVDL